MSFVFIIATFFFPALAELPGATVWTSGSTSAARAIFAPGTNVRILDREAEEKRMREDGYVMPAERDALLRKVGLETSLAGMDDLDKDMLVMAAQEYTLRELQSDYPELGADKLAKLKRELEKRR